MIDESPDAMPQRWTDEPLRGSPVERRAALLVRAWTHSQDRNSIDLVAVHFKLRGSWAGDSGSARRLRRWTLGTVRVATVVAILLLASSVVGAAVWWHRQSTLAPRPAAPTGAAPAKSQRDDVARKWSSGLGVDPVAPAREGAAVGEQANRAAIAGARASTERHDAARGLVGGRSVGNDPHAAQADLVSTGLRLLHRDRNVSAAIATFLAYRARFPDGLFADEVSTALAEAYLAAGRNGDALSALEGASAAGGERRRAQLTLRGELRARLGRCEEAIEDFDSVLATAGESALDERALFGRGICHGRLGHRVAADQDLAVYRRRFPAGRFFHGAEQIPERDTHR